MIEVDLTIPALHEFEAILQGASSPQGAETIKRGVATAVETIATFPRGARYITKHDWYEAVVRKAP